MKATELLFKLNEAITKYGNDCEVRLLEGVLFGSDRYGVGIALVAGADKHMDNYNQALYFEDARDIVRDNLDVLDREYFDVGTPLW